MTIRLFKSLLFLPSKSRRRVLAALTTAVLGAALLVDNLAVAQTILPEALSQSTTSQSTQANLAPPPSTDSPALAMPIASEVPASSDSTAPLPTSTSSTAAAPTMAPTMASTVASTETTAAPLTVSTAPAPSTPEPEPAKTTMMDKPSSAMPLDPPPLPQESRLDNAIRNEAERSFYDAKKQKYQSTFERAYEGLVPLGPNEVRDTMSRYERTQRASVPPSTGQPRGQVRIKTLSLEPGSEPPTVNISSGYVTTITILDATGEPWPILDLGIGGNFEVSKTGGGNHVVRIMPLTRFGYGNLSVLLQDLSTPIIFKLASGGATVDYRFDARIPRLGPNAKLSLIDKKNRLQAGSAEIMGFLDNAPPPEAKRVRMSGADSRTMAWTVDRRMFVRTPLTMLSPAWDSSVSSADGTTVYELNETPVLIMSDNGVLVRARVAPKEEE
jgi:intracellular multiplication protein IcmK